MSLFSSPLFKQLHRVLVHLKMAELTSEDYRAGAYPYSLAVLTRDCTIPMTVRADPFFALLETETRADRCSVTKICLYKEKVELSPWNHEFLVIEILGPDGSTKYNLRFERTGSETNDGQNSSHSSASLNGSGQQVEIVSSHTRSAGHSVTVFPSSQIQGQAQQTAYEVVTHEYDPAQPTPDEGISSPSTGQPKERTWIGGKMKRNSKTSAARANAEGAAQTVPARLTLRQFARLSRSVMSVKPYYNLKESSCYWLTAATLKAVDEVLQCPASTRRTVSPHGQTPAGHLVVSGSMVLGSFDGVSKADVEAIVERYRASSLDLTADGSDDDLYQEAYRLRTASEDSPAQQRQALAIRATQRAEEAEQKAEEAEQKAEEAEQKAEEEHQKAETQQVRAETQQVRAVHAEERLALTSEELHTTKEQLNATTEQLNVTTEELSLAKERATAAEEALKAFLDNARAGRDGETQH